MAQSIHINTMREMLKAGDPVDITLWTKSLRYDFYKGDRRVKLLDSRQIRTVRDVCIFEINNLTVFL